MTTRATTRATTCDWAARARRQSRLLRVLLLGAVVVPGAAPFACSGDGDGLPDTPGGGEGGVILDTGAHPTGDAGAAAPLPVLTGKPDPSFLVGPQQQLYELTATSVAGDAAGRIYIGGTSPKCG